MKQLFAISVLTIVLCYTSGCDNTEDECIDVVVDEDIKTLYEYNKAFYDEYYTGRVVTYFDDNNEQPQWVLHYIDGEIVKYESFYENGDPKIVKPIKCNSSHGNLIYYMGNSQRGYEIEYKFGRKDGVGKSYFEDGQVQRLVRFKNDEKHGALYEFTESGDTILKEMYENGRKIY